MNGIDKITARIRDDAKTESEAALAEARREVEEILKDFDKEAASRAEETARRGALQADEQYKRRESIADLEARKKVLEAKQDMLDTAFARVPEAINSLPDEKYISFLSNLAALHSRSGTEQVLLSADDVDKYGGAVIAAANKALKAQGKPASLTLSGESADIDGGLILREGDIEVNCAIGTILQFIREEISGEVANVLFG